MKKYQPEEIHTAYKKLPKPVADFLASKKILDIYSGIEKKLGLSIGQGIRVSEIANATLSGLEDEHALETNIHQWLPELSNQSARELVADLQDRVFKERDRRVRENITEPGLVSLSPEPLSTEDAEEVRKRDIIDAMDDDDPELLKLEKEQRERETAKAKADEEELAASLKEAHEWEKNHPKNSATAGSVNPVSNIIPSSELPLYPETVVPSIATEKLAAPSIRKEEITLQVPSYGSGEIESGPTPSSSVTPPPVSTPPVPPSPQPYKAADPYREPID